MTSLPLLVRLAGRSALKYRGKSLLVAVILAFGAFVLVLGQSLLDSVHDAMADAIISSMSGHLQVYSGDAIDDLSLFGEVGGAAPDIGEIDDFGKLKTEMEKVDNVQAVVPMGTGIGSLSTPGEFDRAVGELREAMLPPEGKARDPDLIDDRIEHVRNLTQLMKVEQDGWASVSEDTAEARERTANLDKVTADKFWDELRADPQPNLLFLDTRIAPLWSESKVLIMRYLGTDLDAFKSSFSRMHIVRGEMVPTGTRGMLVAEKFYEEQFKNLVARELDALHTAVVRDGRSIALDPRLKARAERLPRQYNRLMYLFGPRERNRAAMAMRSLHGDDGSATFAELLQKTLTVDDTNIVVRHEFFYEHIAPLVQLYPFEVGDVVTIRGMGTSGYVRSVNVKVYGTYGLEGLETSMLAGVMNLTDLVTFRQLYGQLTEEEVAELEAIKEEAGVEEVTRDNAEDALFGGDDAGVVEVDAPTKFDELERLDIGESAGLADTFDPREMERGLVLHAAVKLERDDARSVFVTRQRMLDAANDAGLNIKVVDWQQAAGILGQYVTVIQGILYVSVFIVFIVAMVIINNGMVTATMDRTAEIGTMRAIGAGRRFVMTLFVIETLIIGAAAGLTGALLASLAIVLLGWLGIPAGGNEILTFLFGGPRLYPAVAAMDIIVTMVVIMVVASLSTFYPAMIATRIQPVVAMQTRV